MKTDVHCLIYFDYFKYMKQENWYNHVYFLQFENSLYWYATERYMLHEYLSKTSSENKITIQMGLEIIMSLEPI